MDAVIYINEVYSKKAEELDIIIGDSNDIIFEGKRFFSAGYPMSCRETVVDEMNRIQRTLETFNVKISDSTPTFICVVEEDFQPKYKDVLLKVARIIFNNGISWYVATIKDNALYVAGRKYIEILNSEIKFFYYNDVSFFYKRDTPLISLLIFLARGVDILDGRILPEDFVYIFDVLEEVEKQDYGYNEEDYDEDEEEYNDYESNEYINYIGCREVLLSVFGYWFLVNCPGEFSALLGGEGYYNGIATLMSGMLDKTKTNIKTFLSFLEKIGNPKIPSIYITWFGRSFSIKELKKLTEAKTNV